MDGGLIAMRMRLSGGKQVAAEAEVADAAIAKTDATATAAGRKASSGIRRSLTSQIQSMRSIGRGLTKYVTLPILGVAAISGKFALDFDRNMRNVNSIAQLPTRQFERLKQSVLDLAGPTAQTPNTLAEGLYDLVSSGFSANEAIRILHKSALAASAGLTTTEVATKAVAAALNAYHLPANKAGQVSDQLFETVNRGVLTFDQLANSIGDALPFASQLGVGLDQVGAAISTMTKQGLSAPESVTRLKNVLVTLIKPGKALNDALNSMNTSGAALVREKGLQGALEAVIGTTNGSKAAIAALFPNIRALGGVLSLTGKSAKSAHEDLDAFKNTTGATARVLHEQEKSFGFQMQRAWAGLQAVLIEIGSQVLPLVIPPFLQLVGLVRDAVHWLSKAPGPIKRAAGELILLAATAGPLLYLAGTLAKATLAIQALFAAESAGGAGTAGLFAGAGPALAFIAILGLEVIAFTTLYNKVKWFRDATDVIWKWIGNQATFLLSPIALLIIHFDLLKKTAADVATFLSGAFAAATQWVGNAIDNAGAVFAALPEQIGSAVSRLPGIIWGALRKTPRLLGRFIAFWLVLPIRIAYIFVTLQVRIVKALARLIPKLASLAARAVASLVRGFITYAPQVISFWVSLNLRILKFMAMLPVRLASYGAKAVLALAKALIGASPAIWAWAKGVPGKILHLLGSAVSKFFALGKKIASEIANGLKQGLSDLLPGPIKDALGGAGGIANEVGGFLGFASGTLSAPGGLALVGEFGPELVNLPRRSEVIPAGRTEKLLGSRGRRSTRAEPAAGSPALERLIRGDRRPRTVTRQPVQFTVNKRVLAEGVVEVQDEEDARK